MPEIITYSMVSQGSSVFFPGFGVYLPLYKGAVQTISVTVRGGTGSVHLSYTPEYKTRYFTRKLEDGQTVVLPNVARPEGGGQVPVVLLRHRQGGLLGDDHQILTQQAQGVAA